jgi:hypothetical protein
MPVNTSTHFRLDLTFQELKDQGFISGINKEEYDIVDPIIPNVLHVQMLYDEGDTSMK